MKYFIYELIDPRDNLPFYIGQTINLENRFKDHCKTGNNEWKKNPHKTKVVYELKKQNIKPIMNILFEDLTKKEVDFYENEIINGMKLCGYKLTNIQLDFCGSYVRTDEIKNKISKKLSGTKFSIERKTKQSKIQKEKSYLWSGENNGMFGVIGESHPSFGLKTSDETKEKQSISKIGIDAHKKLNDKNWLYQKYIIERKSSTQIASELQVSKPTVLYKLNIYFKEEVIKKRKRNV